LVVVNSKPLKKKGIAKPGINGIGDVSVFEIEARGVRLPNKKVEEGKVRLLRR
jgi:hypothetical protein